MIEKEKLIESLRLNLSDRADTIERLFCCAVINEDSVTAERILKRYNEYREVLGIKSTPKSPNSADPAPKASPKPCPDDCEQRKGRFCMLSANHCERRADDYYRPGTASGLPQSWPKFGR